MISSTETDRRRQDTLQSFFIEFKQDFERSRQPCCLHFAPKLAFVTANAIHDTTDISEVSFEFLFYDL